MSSALNLKLRVKLLVNKIEVLGKRRERQVRNATAAPSVGCKPSCGIFRRSGSHPGGENRRAHFR